jgi:ribonuclease PH
MKLERSYNRNENELRPVEFKTDFYDYTEGSCLVSFGKTKVLCVATIEDNVPYHMKNTGKGWITAEYAMLPRSSSSRIKRERPSPSGRSQEIQRLIGRSLRSVFKNEGWGERSILVDCDVLQADGGTRTASITGAFVAVTMAFRFLQKAGKIAKNTPFPAREFLSAVSVGIVNGKCLVDLDYSEDSNADTDMNLVMTSQEKFVEIQGTAEKEPFEKVVFDELLEKGRMACNHLCSKQRDLLGDLAWG